MSRIELLQRMTNSGVVAVVRAQNPDQLTDVARALVAGGVVNIEITMTVPGAIDVIRKVSADLGDEAVVGAGTVLDAETARACILAGADYVVAPILDVPTIQLAHRYDKPCFPGAFTPTEVLRAWEAGADIVKLFPAGIGGPSLLKAIKGPLPQVKMLPTGGVNLDTAADFIKAGAELVAAGGELVKKSLLENNDMAGLTKLAQQYVDLVREARGT